jgi:two-component system response regulator FlrC
VESVKSLAGGEGLGSELRDQEYAIILETLIECNGRRKEIAEKLGISPRTLRYKLAKMRDAGIEIPC